MFILSYMYMYYIYRVMSNDLYNSQCLFIYIVVFVEFKKVKGNFYIYIYFNFLGNFIYIL